MRASPQAPRAVQAVIEQSAEPPNVASGTGTPACARARATTACPGRIMIRNCRHVRTSHAAREAILWLSYPVQHLVVRIGQMVTGQAGDQAASRGHRPDCPAGAAQYDAHAPWLPPAPQPP